MAIPRCKELHQKPSRSRVNNVIILVLLVQFTDLCRFKSRFFNDYNQFNNSRNNEKQTVLPKVLVRLSTLVLPDLLMPKLSVARGNSVNFEVWMGCPYLPNFQISISAHLLTHYSSFYILWSYYWCNLHTYVASGQDFLQNTLPDIVFLWFHVVEEVFGYSWM